jgi:hypothetical protein
MERVYDIGQLLKYQATASHWITATTRENGITQSEVEYAKVVELVDKDAYLIAAYTSELELIAFYSNPIIESSAIDAFLHPSMIKPTVEGYKRLKEKIKK